MAMTYDRDAAVKFLWEKALHHKRYLDLVKEARRKGKRYQGHCAAYVRDAIQAGGITLPHGPPAKDYRHILVGAGFHTIRPDGPFEPGDIVVIQDFYKTPGNKVQYDHPDGHIAMFSGKIWVSEFRQETPHLKPGYPGLDYDHGLPAYAVYRYPSTARYRERSA
jgi:hypothetical protein